VRGEDDFDGDGMSNRAEYLAGSFPFLDYDYLRVEQSTLTPNGRLRLTFLSVPGKSYSVLCTTNLAQPVWAPCAFALSDTSALQTLPAEGNGGWFSLYLPVAEPTRFFSLSAE
jgi:hypothetical protein